MKKIIIFNASSSLYGAERGLINLTKALNDDFDITVVLSKKGPLIKKIKEVNPSANILVFPLAILMFSFSPLYFIKFIFLFFIDFFFFLFYINYNGIDIVSTNSLLLIFPALCARLLRKPHVWHMREVFPYKIINLILSRYVRTFSSQVVCQSEFIKQKLCMKREVSVIYEPLDGKDYRVYEHGEARRLLRVPSQAVVVSIISRIHPAKGQYEFIRGLKNLLRNGSNTVLFIAGDITPVTSRNKRYRNVIKEYIRRYRLDNVRLLGFTEDVGLILSAADICVFPFKREEPFGIAVAEALAFNKLTFYPMTGGLKEVHDIFKRGSGISLTEIVKRIRNYKQAREEPKTLTIPEELSLSNYRMNLKEIYTDGG